MNITTRVTLGVTAAALAGLTLAACGSTHTAATHQASTSAAPQTATSQPATTYPQAAKAGDFGFRVVSVRTARRLPLADQSGTGPATASAGQVFVIVKVAITNDGQSPEAADGGNVDSNPQGLLHDSRGHSYTVYEGALNTSWTMGGNYNPGSVNADDVVFEAPKGTTPAYVAVPAAGYGENGQPVSGYQALSVQLSARQH